jgi:hypothetical protein
VGFNAWRRCAAIRSSRSWPTTKAEVTYTDIDSHYDSQAELTVYSPRVWYSYQVGGKTYEGEVELPTSTSHDTAEESRAPYRKERSFALRYAPRNPARAVLEGQTVRLRDIGLVTLAAATGMIGIALITLTLFDR